MEPLREASIRGLNHVEIGLGIDLQRLVRIEGVAHAESGRLVQRRTWIRRGSWWPWLAEASTLPDVPASSTDLPRPRQRWRIRYARQESAAALTQREEVEAWTEAVVGSGLPVVMAGDPPRPRLAFGPPLPVGCVADDEPLDVLLDRLMPLADVSGALGVRVPPGHSVRAIHDVWLGAPSLQAAGRAVDYEVLTGGLDASPVGAAAARLLAAAEVPRVRTRAGRDVRYDLRPLVEAIVVDNDESSPTVAGARILFRFRLDPERGIGRPDDLVAALEDGAGIPITTAVVRRTRVWLADDPQPGPLR
jgi:radical SAM-linked protein